MTLKFSKGPSVILNSGSLNQSSLGKVDKFNNYSTCYVVGVGNRSFQELKRIVTQLIEDNLLNKGVKMPWRVDEKTNMVSIIASSKKPVPILKHDDTKAETSEVRDGDFCKVNITPSAYKVMEEAKFRLPDGSMGQQFTEKHGVKLFLNGIKLLSSDEELF